MRNHRPNIHINSQTDRAIQELKALLIQRDHRKVTRQEAIAYACSQVLSTWDSERDSENEHVHASR